MKNLSRLIVAMMIMAIMNSCNLQENPVQKKEIEISTKTELNSVIEQSLLQDDEFKWDELSDSELYSAIISHDSIAVIGYQPSESSFSNWEDFDIKESEWTKSLNNVMQTLERAHLSDGIQIPEEGLQTQSHSTLPFLKVKISSPSAVTMLRQMGEVRYIEPHTYYFSEIADVDSEEYRTMGKLGCGNSPDSYLEPADYVSASPAVKVSWNYYTSNIPQAWNLTTGKGITIGMIDTGLSPDQAGLNSQFNSGWSSGRYLRKYGTYVSSWWWWARPDGPNDKCGHGTQMAGVIAGQEEL
ncbi:S8 family serine peptidase [Mangrovivirga cuniculi]|uniref:S8 family serine peptidase n=1 Tax=Mangrovivirga cuniculi TaxID=2715131 RepID=UPI001C2F5B9C|nr:S8 family serine peptidase [Mangrovivirga cuniculi]